MKTIKKFWKENGEDLIAAGMFIMAIVTYCYAMWIFA